MLSHDLRAKPLFLLLLCLQSGCTQLYNEPIKVGVLHAQTGVMSVSEKPVVDATLMAIAEINESGGVLGRKLEAVVVDTQSSDERAVMLSKQLIEQDKVEVVFGCWTSSCRKSVKPIFESNHHLLFYPVQYEGLESSENIIYLGAVPNQQLMPATHWFQKKYGPRFLLIASDYVFPHVANKLIKRQLSALGAQAVGEFYYPLGHDDFSEVFHYIKNNQVTAIINTLNGNSNTALFKMFAEQKITTPILSFSLSEQELINIKISKDNNIYAAESYFQSINGTRNGDFKRKISSIMDEGTTISAPMIAAYNGVHLWRNTVEKFKSYQPSNVRRSILGEMISGPSGDIRISMMNNHTWNPYYLAKLNASKSFEIIEKIQKPIRPMPFPPYGNKQYWYDFIASLYQGWGERWSNEHAGKQPRPVLK